MAESLALHRDAPSKGTFVVDPDYSQMVLVF